MGLYDKLPEGLNEVDVIVAGGGSAGCIVAARLAEADPKLSILLIEQGSNNYNVPQVIHPGLFPQNIAPGSGTALFWQGNHAKQLAERAPVVPSGGILGGGSSINWMVYTRAQRSDFDSWKQPGWSANDLFPYLKKFETYHGNGDKDAHGLDGPINISSGTFRALRAENDFIEAAAKMGYHELKDLQNLDNNNGTERWLRYVGPDGRRQDAAHRYIHPKLQSGDYPNLHVLVEHQVKRVLFDENKRAVGVEIKSGHFRPKTGNTNGTTNGHTNGSGPSMQSVKAKKLVVLSTGANGTPLVLERSGVGNPEILKRAGVPVVVDLPGVGHDYQDHHLSLWTYRTSLTASETINGLISGRADVKDMIQKKHELLGWNSMDASGKFRPTEQDVVALGPEFKAAWDRDFKNAPDRPLMIIAMYLSFLANSDHSVLPDDAEYISCANWTAYPYSRGYIHITGPELSDRVDFNVGYLTDANDIDVKKHIWAYKLSREMFRRMSIYRGELAIGHPRFPAGSKAAVVEKADGPVPDDAPPIQYSAADDEAIDLKIRETVGTTWHSLGTCKMAPREKMGVVDASLGVYGTRGLKLADLSVPPENVGANTNNTALMIGEKAADIFIKELGLAK
ncbi:Cellobiose dehydrogenase [Sphaceloma murrayae]|uniref:Cellobiose dehydrogenase n=1 Tax=Sphaceloma murrayae TaxID=2082308 RepID=A0A2K1QYD5_9PEZI|nr:Cellobiose dehydrogenase [Sphaceloma murrayae]